ncbi:MAG: sensor histidine kinase [Spirochaeta sp.]
MKRSILLILVAMIGLTALGLSLFFGLSFSHEMDRIVTQERQEITSQVAQRLRLLDEILQVLERDARREAEESLRQAQLLLAEYQPDPRLWSSGLLARVAEEIGRVDLYLIDRNFIIQQTTFEPDMGMQLSDIGPQFSQFLASVLGSGAQYTQRLAISNTTGRLMIYSYLSPPGAEYILQLSLDFNEYLERQEIDFSPALFFQSLLTEHTYIQTADLATFNGLGSWSLISGERVVLEPDIIDQLQQDQEVRFVQDDLLVTYKQQAFLSRDNPFGEMFVLMLHYDLSYYQQVLERFYLRGALITFILTVIFSTIAGVILEHNLIRNVSNFKSILLCASQGTYSARLPMNQRVPEYREIASAFNTLMESASRREQELQKQAENLTAALDQRDVLLREIHHRVKNNLQIITSLISIEQTRVDDRSIQVFSHINTRVRAMSAVHEILYEADNLQGAQLEQLVERVFRAVMAVYAMDQQLCTFTHNLLDTILPIDTAIPLSLILTEAFTNSLKYAATHTRVVLRVTANFLPGGGWQLQICDNGPGFPEGMECSDGFGFILMRGLAEQIGGRLELLNNNGAVVRITMH